MADTVIEIAGNAVTVIERVVKSSGTTAEFLKKLQERPALIENIPANCIAIGSSANQTIYHIAVDAHISPLAFAADEGGNPGPKKQIFLPYSVFSISVRENADGTLSILSGNWSFCTERPNGQISNLAVYQNFLPNTREIDNQICFGSVKRGFKKSDNIDLVLQNAIADIRGSIYTAHWMEGRKFTQTLENAVSEYHNKTAKDTVKKRLEKINQLLRTIEACDWENMTDAQADEKAAEREKLTKEREKKLRDIKAKVTNWQQYYFDFLEWWTTENKELIETDKAAACKALLIETMNYKKGHLGTDGYRKA